MTANAVVIYGGGGFAREVAWLAQDAGFTVACFIDDDETKHGAQLNGIPVMGLDAAYAQFPTASVVGGIGAPRVRELVLQKAEAAGFAPGLLIHPNVQQSNTNSIGPGAVICAGNILTVNITLGRHVQINLDCTVGHDVVMGDFTTLAPGVHVSGWVHMGQRVYIGTGANIINGTREKPLIIEDDAVVGSGACVTKRVAAGTTVVGVPARPLGRG